MRPFLFIGCICFVLSSCNVIFFDQPPPASGKTLASFPKNYQGSFLFDGDTLLIGTNSFTSIQYEKRYFNVQSLDTLKGIKIKNDLIFDEDYSPTQGLKYTLKNDSIFYRIRNLETNSLSDSMRLKKYRSYFVLSGRDEIDTLHVWVPILLKQLRNHDILCYSTGTFDKQKDNFVGNLTEYEMIVPFKKLDVEEYLVKPSDEQFGALIEKGLFVPIDTLYRIR